MATYFHGNTEIQSASSGQDGLQTLVLMNPTGYIPYSDTSPPQQSSSAGNLVFLNSAAATLAHHHHHAPPHQQHQQQHFLASGGGGDMSGFHHGFLPQRVHYNVWTPPPETPSPSARDTPRAGTPLQQGLSLTLSSQQLGFGSPHAPPSGDDARGVSVASSAVSGVTTGGGAAGIQSVLLSSKYLRAAQELLEEVVNVGAGIGADISGKKSNGGGSKSVGESSGAAASGDGSGGGSGKRSSPAELTPAERQEVQMKKAKLIAMLDEVEQRYRQYHQQMQIVICSFEQAAGMGSARTYTALALQTISKQFRCLKDAIAGQIRAAAKSLGEETDGGGGGSRLKFVDHHLRQQRALQQLGMIQHNAWRPQRGLPERSVSVLRAWLFEHFLHPYPKDSDKHMLAKQTGLTRSQVSNWFINARVRLWKPMVEEMYLEEIKEQNGSQAADNKVDNSSDASKSSPTAAAIEARDDNIDPSVPPSLVSPRPGGFSLVGSSELDGIARARNNPKKARCDDGDGDALTSPNAHHHNHRHLTVDVKADEENEEDDDDNDDNQVSMGRDGYSFMGGHQTNFIGGFGQYPIAEIGRPFDVVADPDPFTPRYSSGGGDNNNGFSLTLGLPHHHLSLSGGSHHHHHQGGFVQAGPVIQLGGGGRGGVGIRRVDHLHHHHMGEVGDQFVGSINASPHPHSSSAAAAAAFDAINIQNPKRFAAQLLPDYVS